VLTIRNAQLEALAQAHQRERLLDLVRDILPARFAAVCREGGRAAAARWIREALQRAPGYGITRVDHQQRFVLLMFALGRADFDTALPWVAGVLGWDPEQADAETKLGVLEAQAKREG
jgi:hypothetical protein